MIKPRLCLYVCAAAVAVTLGGTVLTQAAGPGEFISRLWKREPAPKKEVSSGFSPFRWLRGKKSEPTVGSIKVSDGGRTVISERPELTNDPFLATQQTLATRQTPAPQQNLASDPIASTNTKVIVRPERRRTATADTLAASTSSTVTSGVVGRNKLTGSAPTENSRRDTASAQPSSSTRPTGNGGFVDGFDNEFQKLVESVVAESRERRQETATPKLPDDLTTDIRTPRQDAEPEATIADAPEEQQLFTEFDQKRSGGTVSELIRESRRQMDSSVFAPKSADQASSQRAGSDSTLTNRSAAERSDVAAASHSRSNQTASSGSAPSDSSFLPQRLPDQLGHNDNQLVVPSSIVPDGELFTPTEVWLTRSRNQRHEAGAKADSAQAQPVVRVIPGSRGNRVVIESGQWSPIRPRVSSNVAPSRSVPDTSKFRRLSFDGADGSPQNGAVLAVEEAGQNGDNTETESGQTGGASFTPPALAVPSELPSEREAVNDLPIMLPPDGRTDPGMDAAQLGAALSDAPGPPLMQSTTIDWPDESEFAPVSPSGGMSWGTAAFFLVLTGGVASLFFRRKRQGGAFGITQTSS